MRKYCTSFLSLPEIYVVFVHEDRIILEGEERIEQLISLDNKETVHKLLLLI
jgi:hypothetical protein